MEKIKLINSSAFKVYKDFELNDTVKGFLNELYLPIVGEKAINLYLYLCDFKYSESIHDIVIKETNLSIYEIADAREKLEAIKLVKTYYKDNSFFYELQLPLSYHKFFKDKVLREVLKSKVTKKLFKELEDKSKSRIPSKYINISAKATEVFNIKELDVFNEANLNFNLQTLISKLEAKDVDTSILNSDTLNKLNVIYHEFNLDLSKLVRYICLSYNDNSINIDNITRLASTPTIKKKIDTNIVYSGFKTLDDKIRMYEETNPIDFMKFLNGGNISQFERNKVTDIINDSNSSFGIINVCIDYCIKESNGKFYYNNIIEQIFVLKRNKINNVHDALTFFETKKPKKVIVDLKDDINNENNINEEDDLDIRIARLEGDL